MTHDTRTKTKVAPTGDLTLKEQRFIQEYLIDGNGTRAHRAAGYRAKNDNVRSVQAARMLGKAKIQDAVAKGQQAFLLKSEKSQEDVRNEFISIGFSDMGDYMEYSPEKGVKFIAFSAMTPEKRRAIKTFREVETEYRDKNGNVTSVKRHREIVLHDKIRALEGLARQFGMEDGKPPALTFWQQLININPRSLTDEQLLMIRNGQIPEGLVKAP